MRLSSFLILGRIVLATNVLNLLNFFKVLMSFHAEYLSVVSVADFDDVPGHSVALCRNVFKGTLGTPHHQDCKERLVTGDCWPHFCFTSHLSVYLRVKILYCLRINVIWNFWNICMTYLHWNSYIEYCILFKKNLEYLYFS